MVPFSFHGEEMGLVKHRALYWPRENALLVADLHLEKASFFAQTGQMLPPYDSRETLERLALAIRETGARRLFALGDNFHDGDGAGRIEEHAAGMLAALTRAVEWVWITGNHDPAPGKIAGGESCDELAVSGVILRHKASPGERRPEISGHFHPRLTLAARGRRIARPCAVASETRLILPAFGALAGGLDAGDPAILSAMQPALSIAALIESSGRALHYPLWQAPASARREQSQQQESLPGLF
jgi:DNA ligase-associated metallophosphoesterase